MKIKSILCAATAAAMVLSMCSCSSSKEQNESVSKCVTLTESFTFDTGFFPLITPETCQNFGITYWTHNFYQTLVQYEDGKLIGDAAESWNVSDDGLTYTFKLKSGLKFSDGTDLNAQAVKTSMEAVIVNLGSYNGSYGKGSSIIETVEATDEQTVVITVTQPYYSFLNDLTMCNMMGIVNPTAFNDDLTYKAEDVKTATFGSGPYMYEGDFSDNTYTFVSNPYYSGEKPEADTFKIKVISDNNSKTLALRSGEIDIITGGARLGMDAYTELSDDSQYKTAMNSDATLTRMVAFNLSDGVFTDDTVREAVSYAIDKEAICTNVMQGIDTVATTFFSSSNPYCDVDVASHEYDTEKAKSILEAAGWIDSDGDGVREKDGKKLETRMKYSTGYGSISDYVLTVVSQLEAIGFKVEATDEEIMTYYGSMMTYDFDMLIMQTYGGAFDPSCVATNMNPDTSADPVSLFYSSYFDGGNALIAELDSTTDMNRVQEIYQTVLTTINDKSLAVPISYQHEIVAWNTETVESYTFDEDPLYINVYEINMK